ncbi:sugar ABC transporter ATP-binding protein [Zhihengliuella halotolerans]|uniref:Monosaccharide ABC transporter ATP-binding protein (CUT2 family) n=1 Tax=Zhihengliuella halotolerans TaxID=370736 RepID=A0A4Q8A9W9_9MICC|nr:sugar ABC transporter ATP-binding protein [Zhihengliuella halotolerans]RZU60880.1 monosaccharide ABC transporter ATP-binding protein (CUT2 family) [Zhihengliuella halotolerans]
MIAATPAASAPAASERTTADPVVEMRGITVEFPGVKALDGVDFRLFPGEVHALMGENGAGKSTLIKALTGVNPITAGGIAVAGVETRFAGPADARERGISTVYQEVNLCGNLTVAENIMLGSEPRRFGGLDWQAMRREAARHLTRMGLDIDPASSLDSHSLAIQQLVAISRAMVVDAKVLILDEPTSSLDTDEVAQLFRVMRRLREDGVAILFVSHFLDQIYAISDRITILRNGRLVGERFTSELPQRELVSLMIAGEADAEVGQARARPERAGSAPRGEPLLQAVGLGRKGSVQPFDLELYPGEVVGLAGLLGSGRTELARLLYGADRSDAGSLTYDGGATRLRTPRAALARKIAYTSEDRKGEGVVGDLTVRENIILGLQAARGWMRPLPRANVDKIVGEYIKALGVRPANPQALLKNLSGGNQQKVLLARWLATAPRLLLLDEPTRGIDIGAKTEIMNLVSELAEQGMSVVFISAELEEVLRLSDRIAVMRDRTKVAEIAGGADVGVPDLIDLIASGGEDE